MQVGRRSAAFLELLAAAAGARTWPHSSSWGYGPSGVLGVMLVIIVVLLVMGRL
jgi:hypothetical protein